MGEVSTLTHYFSAPKVEDIRMIYKGTYSGMNILIWSNHLSLPTVQYNIREVGRGTYMEAWDIGETLFKFILSEEARPFRGVEMKNVRMEEGWEKSSPWGVIRMGEK